MATTVQNIIDAIKWQTDLQVGGRLQTADLIPEINDAYAEAWEAMVAAYEDYFVRKVTDFVIVGGLGANIYTIGATDMLKLRAVQRQDGAGNTFGAPLPTHEFNEVGGVAQLSYRLQENQIYFEPELSCGGTYRMWYIPTANNLTLVSDVINDSGGLAFNHTGGAIRRFIIDRVSLRVTMREEESTEAIAQLVNDMIARVGKMSANRNAGRGKKIADVRRTRRRRFMTRSGFSLP